MLSGDFTIDNELSLFTVNDKSLSYSPMNDVLYDKHGLDGFRHEQNLIISGDKSVLIMGCGHSGVVNIMKTAEQYNPQICIGGFHLTNPVTKKTVSTSLLDNISESLNSYSETQFYTCHCTGMSVFEYL